MFKFIIALVSPYLGGSRQHLAKVENSQSQTRKQCFNQKRSLLTQAADSLDQFVDILRDVFFYLFGLDFPGKEKLLIMILVAVTIWLIHTVSRLWSKESAMH